MGEKSANAVYNAVVMEKVAEMDLKTLQLNPNSSMAQYVLDKHYMRKHNRMLIMVSSKIVNCCFDILYDYWMFLLDNRLCVKGKEAVQIRKYLR